VPNGYGIYTASWSIYTPDTVGVAEPVANLVGYGVSTWGPTIDFPIRANAVVKDFGKTVGVRDGDIHDPDTDNDAFEAGVGGIGNHLDVGVVRTLLQIQKWTMLADGPFSLAIYGNDRSEYIDENSKGYSTVFDSVVPGCTNFAASVTIPGGDVEAEDWSGDGGWNNPARFVDIVAVGIDSENDSLTYRWGIAKSKNSNYPHILSETGPNLHLTLADIAGMGLPDPGQDESKYHWYLTVWADDGLGMSDGTTIDVFVPEPATFFVVTAAGLPALLKRKRSRS